MEGRTIARPNLTASARPRTLPPGFNGGPDNCPAKLACEWPDAPQLLPASMEGRTIARPNAGRAYGRR